MWRVCKPTKTPPGNDVAVVDAEGLQAYRIYGCCKAKSTQIRRTTQCKNTNARHVGSWHKVGGGITLAPFTPGIKMFISNQAVMSRRLLPGRMMRPMIAVPLQPLLLASHKTDRQTPFHLAVSSSEDVTPMTPRCYIYFSLKRAQQSRGSKKTWECDRQQRSEVGTEQWLQSR